MIMMTILEELSLGTIQSLIGLVFGLSLAYMARNSTRDRVAIAVGVIIAFFVMLFVLRDYVLARRMVQIFALGHVAMVSIVILRKSYRRRRIEDPPDSIQE